MKERGYDPLSFIIDVCAPGTLRYTRQWSTQSSGRAIPLLACSFPEVAPATAMLVGQRVLGIVTALAVIAT